MRNVSDTNFSERIKTHTLFQITFFSENHAMHEIMRKNMVQLDWSQMTVKYRTFTLHAG